MRLTGSVRAPAVSSGPLSAIVVFVAATTIALDIVGRPRPRIADRHVVVTGWIESPVVSRSAPTLTLPGVAPETTPDEILSVVIATMEPSYPVPEATNPPTDLGPRDRLATRTGGSTLHRSESQ